MELLDQIPVPAPLTSGAATPAGGHADLSVSGTQALDGDYRYDAVTMGTASTLTITGTSTIVAESSFTVGRGATLSIDGDVELVVFGNIIVNKGAIELEPGATLTIYADQNIDLVNGYAGNVRPVYEDRDNSGDATFMNVERLELYDVPGGNAGTWKLSMTSVAKASMYNTEGDIEIIDSSALYGRALGKRVFIRGMAALFYDPSLDDDNGFTNPYSLVYEDDYTINDDILGLSTLDAADIEALSDEIGLTVRTSKNVAIKDALDPGGGDPEPGAATPRPVPVDWAIVSYGMDMRTWEQ